MGQCVSFAGTPAQTEIQTNLSNATKAYATATGSLKNKLISNYSKKIRHSSSHAGDVHYQQPDQH